jgi:phosphatidylglycerol:prolipoprotein diacylglycerol transferase
VRWTGNPQVHVLFEIIAYLTAAAVYTVARARQRDPIADRARMIVLVSAAIGASIGMRLLSALSNWPSITSFQTAWEGKTVVGGLLGGLIAVEIAKKFIGVTRSTGDLFVYPAIIAMCIGRIGCFLAGPIDRTAGDPTSLPWGIAIADGIRRHPVALYEIAFLVILAALLRLVNRDGDRFRFFLASYLAFRLAVDFLKPDPPPIALGLSGIQWACVAGLLYYAMVLTNDDRNASIPFLRRRRVDMHDVLPQD